MEGNANITSGLTKYSRILLGAFAVSGLFSIYLLFMLPSELRFKGNVQYMDLVNPILVRLYFGLGVTAILAVVALYAEMRNKRSIIVYKEKTEAEAAKEKSTAEANRTLDALNSNAITGREGKAILTEALNLLAKELEAVSGASYFPAEADGQRYVELHTGFALPIGESDVVRFNLGEGIVGQVAKSGTVIYLEEIPEGYFQAVSGLGQAIPKFLFVMPLKKGNEVKAVVELATFKSIGQKERQAAEKFANEIGERLA